MAWISNKLTESLPDRFDSEVPLFFYMKLFHESYVVSKSRCPKCAERGADTRADNLSLYSDGHKYCFGCGFYERGDINISFIPQIKSEKPQNYFYLPEDSSPDLPYSVTEWLYKTCHFTMEDIINNKILWSNKMLWLIFPIEVAGSMIGFQARNFNKDKPYKWYTRFPKQDNFIILGKKIIDKLVFVEDIISAIRVARIGATVPLFGSTMPDNVFIKTRRLGFNQVVIWLDEDKYPESIRYSERARELGLKSRIIHTTLDPKNHTATEISHLIGEV